MSTDYYPLYVDALTRETKMKEALLLARGYISLRSNQAAGKYDILKKIDEALEK